MLAIAALVSIGYAHFEFLRWDTVIRIRKRRAQLSTYPLIHCLPEAGRQRGDISSTLALWTMEHNIRKASHG